VDHKDPSQGEDSLGKNGLARGNPDQDNLDKDDLDKATLTHSHSHTNAPPGEEELPTPPLTMGTWNTRGVCSKQSKDFYRCLTEKLTQIFVLTETKIKKGAKSHKSGMAMSLPGYTLLHSCVKDGTHRAGVTLAMHSTVAGARGHSRVDNIPQELGGYLVAAKLPATKNKEGLVVIGTYMPCTEEETHLKDKLRAHMTHMMSQEFSKATVIIMGDFNTRLPPGP
jgi:exonuclease III